MIYTITANPAIDIAYMFNKLSIGDINKCENVFKTAGGKGLNVSKVLKQLDDAVVALGFIGGYTGNYIKEHLELLQIKSDFVETNIETRTCITISHENFFTEIRELSEIIDSKYEQEFFEKLSHLNDAVKIVIISGSMARGLPKDFYVKIIEKLNQKNITVVLDTAQDHLDYVLSYNNRTNKNTLPYAIKPNLSELINLIKLDSKNFIYELELNLPHTSNTVASTFNQCLDAFLSENQNFEMLSKNIVKVLRCKKFDAIPLILISLGDKGAVYKHKSTILLAQIPKIKTVNPVGSGDATVAGLAHSLLHNLSDEEVLKIAMTCGILNAMQELIGHIDMKNFSAVYNQVNVLKVE